jgi:hypothetical protein
MEDVGVYTCWVSIVQNMSKLIPASERIVRARILIQKAHEVPIPAELGLSDLTYVAGVKDLLRQARDLIKFIPQTAGVSTEMKLEIKRIYEEIEQANKVILSKPSQSHEQRNRM